MIKSNGGIIGPDNVTTGGAFGRASGVFKLGEVTNLIKESKWPTAGPGGFQVANSCRFNSASSDNLQKTPSGDGNKKTFTISTWVKRSNISSHKSIWSAGQYQSTAMVQVFFESDDTIHVSQFNAGGGQQARLTTNRLFRDVGAWYHIVAVWDTTQGTAANRLKLYVNGVQETSFSTAAYPDQNDNTGANTNNIPITIGNRQGGSFFFSGYQSECVLLDGTAAAITDLGEFNSQTGIWLPKVVTGLTFGTNGYYLDFKDASNLGNDANGGTDFTENNLTSLDQSTDTCTTNFTTWNSLNQQSSISYSEGNTTFINSSSANRMAFSNFGVEKGKWYAELKVGAISNYTRLGIADISFYIPVTNAYSTNLPNSISYANDNPIYIGGSTQGNFGSFTTGDIISIAMDMDNGFCYFRKNADAWKNSGDPTSGSNGTGGFAIPNYTTKTYCFLGSSFDGGTDSTVLANFGNPSYAISSSTTDTNGFGNFEYEVPTGYFSLNTKNLAVVLA